MTVQESVLLVSLGERFDKTRAADMAERLTAGLDRVEISAFAAVEEADTYVYLRGASHALAEIQARLAESFPGARARVLHQTLDLPGRRRARTRRGTTSLKPMCCPRPSRT